MAKLHGIPYEITDQIYSTLCEFGCARWKALMKYAESLVIGSDAFSEDYKKEHSAQLGEKALHILMSEDRILIGKYADEKVALPVGREDPSFESLNAFEAYAAITMEIAEKGLFPEFCYARKYNCSAKLPVKTPKKKRSIEKKTVLIIQDGTKTVLKKRPNEGLLAGMYEFPMLEGVKTKEEVLEHLKKEGFRMLHIKKAPEGKHIFSHKEWHMNGYIIKVDELEPFEGKDDYLFVETKEAEEKYPLPSAFKVYSKYLSIKTGKEVFDNK